MSKVKSRLRPFGAIAFDLETLLEEMVDIHEMQVGEILYTAWAWLVIHRPSAVEQYLDDGGNPTFYLYKDKDNDK